MLSGHLSHQIEHHLFPDIPAARYPEMAPRVREICERYGQAYNTGTFRKQFGSVVRRLLVNAWPTRPKEKATALAPSREPLENGATANAPLGEAPGARVPPSVHAEPTLSRIFARRAVAKRRAA